jgi:hypothetical protein
VAQILSQYCLGCLSAVASGEGGTHSTTKKASNSYTTAPLRPGCVLFGPSQTSPTNNRNRSKLLRRSINFRVISAS